MTTYQFSFFQFVPDESGTDVRRQVARFSAEPSTTTGASDLAAKLHGHSLRSLHVDRPVYLEVTDEAGRIAHEANAMPDASRMTFSGKREMGAGVTFHLSLSFQRDIGQSDVFHSESSSKLTMRGTASADARAARGVIAPTNADLRKSRKLLTSVKALAETQRETRANLAEAGKLAREMVYAPVTTDDDSADHADISIASTLAPGETVATLGV